MAFTQVIKTLGSVMASMKTAVDSWLSANITNPSNPPLDRSLSLSNACAPADMVGDLKNDIVFTSRQLISEENGGLYEPLFSQGYIGKVASGSDYYIKITDYSSYCALDPSNPLIVNKGDTVTIDNSLVFVRFYKVKMDTNGMRFVSDLSQTVASLKSYTFTESGLYLFDVRKPNGSGGYLNITPQDLLGLVVVSTNGSITSIQDDIEYTDNRLMATNGEWEYSVQLIQGSANKNSNYLTYIGSSSSCITPLNMPVLANKGDIISISDSSYVFTGCHKIKKNSTGIKVLNTFSISGRSYVFKESGLYIIIVRKPNGNTWYNFTEFELAGKVKLISNSGEQKAPQKPADPYSNLYWGGTQYITSCHAHCATTIEGLIQAGYTAIIPTNYRPPKPHYPLKYFYPNVENVDSYLAAPNTEIGANVAPGKAAHFCNPGSFLAIGTDSSATYNGTLDDLINDCRNARKGWFMGGVIINHPTWSSLTADDMKDAIAKYSDILGIEIYNYGTLVSDNKGWAITQWDDILSSGMQCFGFAAPDHALETSAVEDTPYGFIHVLPSCPTDDALLAAIGSGRFYSSLYNDGLKFTNIKLSGTTLTVTASAETQSSPAIKFITATRESTVSGLSGTFTVQNGDVYVRVEASNGNNTLYSNAIML